MVLAGREPTITWIYGFPLHAYGKHAIQERPGFTVIIAKIEALPLRIPFKPGTHSDASAWGDKNLPVADSVLVRVTTDSGIQGWGEAFGFRAVNSVRLAVEQLIAPLCLGKDPAQMGPLTLEVQKKLAIFGRAGPLFYALSALDIALWDIAGKAAGVSVSRLLGGARTDLPCYASLVRFSDPELARAGVRQALDCGFRAVKIHETAFPVIRAAREESGAEVELMVDANCAWTLNEARFKAAQLEEARLKWLEEPVWPPENYDGLAQLRARSSVPIAAGENVSTLLDFGRIMAAGAVDFIQPSPAKIGGISAMRQVFPLAAVHNVPVMPHSFYDGPGLLAAIHVTAALGSSDSMIEWRVFDLEAQLYGGRLSHKGGKVSVPQGPGLGLEPEADVLREYLTFNS